ncbi:MAG: hypothetical protein FJ253_07790 [Phycisphaerae bacterium]|nr:hypothetical protein [Phycisphaerae bacterium]
MADARARRLDRVLAAQARGSLWKPTGRVPGEPIPFPRDGRIERGDLDAGGSGNGDHSPTPRAA